VLADLGALKVMGAMQPGPENKMTVQQGAGAGENIQDLISLVWHGTKVGNARLKTKRKSSMEAIVTNSA